MAGQLHVNGTTEVYSGTGAASALELLGVTVDGVTMQPNIEWDDVFTDHYGPKVPFDRQYFCSMWHIRCEFVWYDLSVLNKWLNGMPGKNATLLAGQLGSAGDLMLQNSLAARLVIRSTPQGTGLTTIEPCYNFHNVISVDQQEVKVGVTKSVWKMDFLALADQQTSGSNAAVIFDTSCT